MTVYLKDYLDRDAPVQSAAALARALRAVPDGGTLRLGGGRLNVSPDGAFCKYYHVSNNDSGEKRIAFPLLGRRDITIDGEGADIVFCGDILPFVIDGCSNITVKNLSIDYRFPQYAQARLLEADEKHTVMEFDNREFFCRVKDGALCFYSEADGWENCPEAPLALEFDAEKRAPSDHLPSYFPYSGPARDHGFLGGMFRKVSYRQLDEKRIAMYGDIGFTHTVGNYVIMTHSRRWNQGFLVNGSRDVMIENVALYHTAAMGVLCQLSENITLDRVSADVREGSGRLLSVNADATHFVNCRGRIVMRGCRFLKMMDDAANIHGIYLKAPRADGAHSFVAGYGHAQQAHMDIFRPGDIAKIIDYNTVETAATLTVVRTEQLDGNALRVFVQEAMPDITGECVVENVSTAPEVLITGCECGDNRPRGFLLSSAGRTVVEGCVFHNMYQGVSIGGEMLNWYESGAVSDVTVRDNEFRNSAYAGGCAICVAAHVKNSESITDFHGRIVIESNRFTMNGRRFLSAANVRALTVRDNVYVRDESLPYHGEIGNGGLDIRSCAGQAVEPVREAADMGK